MSEQAEVMDQVMREAHERHTNPRKIAAYVAGEMDRLMGSGVEWVTRLDEDARVTGYMKRAADWRRSQERESIKVKNGKSVDLPAFASVKAVSVEGRTEYEQLPFDNFDDAQLEQWIDRQTKARDTYSSGIAAAKIVLTYMREHRIANAGDARRQLAERAA
jgi:hypothetical protein